MNYYGIQIQPKKLQRIWQYIVPVKLIKKSIVVIDKSWITIPSFRIWSECFSIFFYLICFGIIYNKLVTDVAEIEIYVCVHRLIAY